MLRAVLFASLIALSAISAKATAEVHTITIRWVSQRCQQNCGTMLEHEFSKIAGVDHLAIDLVAGQAVLTWKPLVPFSYTAINTAMRMVGLSSRDIRLKITGLIRHSGDTVYIVSDGDSTRFDLLNPIVPDTRGSTNIYNAMARQLSPELRDKLLAGESQGLIATIEGPIFMPERNTVPVQIVVDHLQFASTPTQTNTTVVPGTSVIPGTTVVPNTSRIVPAPTPAPAPAKTDRERRLEELDRKRAMQR
jgi:hypothetical protein